MSQITKFTFTIASLTEQSNDLKEIFLAAMQKEGLVSKEQVDEMNKYCFVIAEKSFFGKIWDRLWKNDAEAVYAIVVKVLG